MATAAAAAAASAAAISSVSMSRRHHFFPSQPSIFSFSFTLSPPKSLTLLRPRPASSTILFPFRIRASDDDEDDFDTSFSNELDPDSEIPPDEDEDEDEDDDTALYSDDDSNLYSDDLPPESEEDIAADYEELYGPAFSGISVLGNDVFVEDARRNKETELGLVMTEGKKADMFEERLVQVRRVTKVVKGGKQLQFRAIVIIGDKQGQVGVGVGKGKEVTIAVEKSARDARRNIITVPMTKYLTFPHRSEGRAGAAKVMLRPASPGTGVIAGGSVRVVLEMAGVENALGKQLGSNNALNNARATVDAILKMRQFSEVSLERGIPMEELWK